MILSELKEYLKQNGQVSLSDVAVRFDISESAAQGMLEHWERKGLIRQVEHEACRCSCGRKCASCPMNCSKTYQWTGA